MPEVSVIIVSMNRPDLLEPCLQGILDNNRRELEILVVAYMYSAKNLDREKAAFPSVKFVVSNELRGFSENNNLALAKASGKYCFIVNDDTLMDSPVIDSLVSDFERLEAGGHKVAAISPNIVFPDGRVQTCGRPPHGAWSFMLNYLHLYDETRPTEWSMKEGLFRTYTLNGAAFLIRTDVFREEGWFDETYTFTPEDIALGTLLNAMGWEIYADADVRIVHFANSTASRMEEAIKPTRVRGALIFQSGRRHLRNPQMKSANPLIYGLLGLYAWIIEAARGIMYLFRDTSDPSGHNAIMAATSRNVRRNIFTCKSTKEIFTSIYNSLKK